MHDKRDRDRFIGTAAQSDADELQREQLRRPDGSKVTSADAVIGERVYVVEGQCPTCEGSPWDAASSTWCPTCNGDRLRPCALCKGKTDLRHADGRGCHRCDSTGFERAKACKCGATFTDSPSGEHSATCTRGAFQRRIEEVRAKHGEKVHLPSPADEVVDDHAVRMKAAAASLTLALGRCVSVLVETAMHLEGIDVVEVKAQGPDHPAWRRVKVALDIEASRFMVVIDEKQATPWHGFLIGVNEDTGQIEGVFVPMGDDEADDTEPPPPDMTPTRTIEGRCRKCGDEIVYREGVWCHRDVERRDCYAEPMPEA
jgi:hypothetical protein